MKTYLKAMWSILVSCFTHPYSWRLGKFHRGLTVPQEKIMDQHEWFDDTRLDEAWLRHVRFIEDDGVFSFAGLHLRRIADDWRMQVGGTDGFWEYMPSQCRGDVRMVLYVLGVHDIDSGNALPFVHAAG